MSLMLVSITLVLALTPSLAEIPQIGCNGDADIGHGLGGDSCEIQAAALNKLDGVSGMICGGYYPFLYGNCTTETVAVLNSLIGQPVNASSNIFCDENWNFLAVPDANCDNAAKLTAVLQGPTCKHGTPISGPKGGGICNGACDHGWQGSNCDSPKLEVQSISAEPAEMSCPSTPAFGPAAGMKISTVAATSCDKVAAEIKARVNGQSSGAWHDPHNNGKYTLENYGGTVSTSRLTGDDKYTDKQIFTLAPDGDNCKIDACSRSQVTSVFDKGTNYCDLKMLFCGKADGCKPLVNDFTVGTETTEKFAGASVDLKGCLVTAQVLV